MLLTKPDNAEALMLLNKTWEDKAPVLAKVIDIEVDKSNKE